MLNVVVTKTDFIFDFKDFQVQTSKGYIKGVKNLYWENNCLMIETDDGDLESIGLNHVLFGEEPLNEPCDYVLSGKDTITKEELNAYLKSVKDFTWSIA